MPAKYDESRVYQRFSGLDVSQPELLIDPSAQCAMQNMMVRYGELVSRPPMRLLMQPTPDGNAIRILRTFIDANNVMHTVAVTYQNAYQLNAGWLPSWTPAQTWHQIGGASLTGTTYDVQGPSCIFVNKLFFSMGDSIFFYDGLTDILQPASTFTNLPPTTAGAFFMGELAFSLIALFTIEYITGTITTATVDSGGTGYAVGDTGVVGSQASATYIVTAESGGVVSAIKMTYGGGGYSTGSGISTTASTGNGSGLTLNITAVASGDQFFQQRVRWSANGEPAQFDPTINTSAGFDDMLDVEDIITGFSTIGTNGYIFRTNGITEMSPTGNGLNPFSFNHLWASTRGIGNAYPQTIATYGGVCLFVASDNVYSLTAASCEQVGRRIVDVLFPDLSAAVDSLSAAIIPAWRNGFVFLTYCLWIPQAVGGVMYQYDIEAKTWTRHVTNSGYPTGPMNLIATT